MAEFLHNKYGITFILLALLICPIDTLGFSLIRGTNDNSMTILNGEFGVRGDASGKKANLTHLFARETGHATLNSGAMITRLVATGQSKVDITGSAEVNYIEADGKAIIDISDGVVGYLIMVGNSQANIKKIVISAALYPISGGILTDGGIIFSPGAVIHVWADNVSFEEGRLKGKWADGNEFSILLFERKTINDEEKCEIAKSLPQQIKTHKTQVNNVN